MGTYLNPGNSGFESIVKSKYVDKTEMIGLLNRAIGTSKNLICVSRPRRFGKSYAAQMLCAYYDKTCSSEGLFKGRRIAEDRTFYEHLNKYDVIYLDVTGIKPYTDKYTKLVPFITDRLAEEFMDAYKKAGKYTDLTSILLNAVNESGNKLITIIDEWDAPIRENPSIQTEYLEFLRSLFKNSGTTAKIFAAAYMTGILPVKKDRSQSAISDFEEYTMLKPRKFGEYVGFTEREVMDLCEEYNADFQSMKHWYDGYSFRNTGSVYNPSSVMKAIEYEDFDSYWTKTSAAEGLASYINVDFEGLQEITARLISGEEVEVNTGFFNNDFITFKSRDDVLTLLIHLGYLSYNDAEGTVRIPNEEIRLEFKGILRGIGVNDKWVELISRSRKLLEDTIEGNSDSVVRAIEDIRDTEYAPTFYNDEQALRYIIKFAYIAAVDQYLKVEELPSGHGIADVVYIPKRRSRYPALLVELKWNKSAEGAIQQIKDRNYPAVLKDLWGSGDHTGNIMLVGISYNADTKKHSCIIEEYDPENSSQIC